MIKCNSRVATVDENSGVVKANKKGMFIITATVADENGRAIHLKN